MKKVLIIFSIFLFNCAYCAQFGQYNFNNATGIQRQLQAQKINKIRQEQRARYYQNPTRNIRYPSASNPYPNITRSQNQQYGARQRYNSQYYQNQYNNRNNPSNDEKWL